MKKQIILLICFALGSFWVQGQTWNQYKKEAKKAFKNQEYGEVLFFLDTLQKIDSAKFNLQYLQAEAARHYNAFELAEKSYQKVIDSDYLSLHESARFGLATVQKMQGKYTEAINGFNQYLSILPKDKSQENKEALAQIQACEWAMELSQFNDKDLKIKQLGEEVNTDYSDFAPYYYQEKLIFSSLRFTPPYKKGKKENSARKYSKVLQLPDGEAVAYDYDLGTKNEELHTAHIAFNKMGDRMYFNICEFKEGNIIQCKIYSRNKISDTIWSEAMMLPEKINHKASSTTQPNIGYDEATGQERLFFISNRTGGKGGKDLWAAYLDENGTPSEPQNLRDLNTEKDEFSPYFHNYTQTLYFSSNGRKSLGGFDIYKSYQKEEKWQEVVHTGFPLNSSYNDVYFSLNHIGSEGYLASNREGTAFLDKQISACCYDIFKAEFNSYLLDLNVLTYLQQNGTEQPLDDVSVSVYELFENAEQDIPHKMEPEGNSHFFRIKSNKKYKIVAEKKDYFPAELNFDTEGPIEGDVVLKKMYLKPLRLNVLTFTDEPPKAPLSEVNVRLVEITKDGKEVEIPFLIDPNQNSYLFPLKSDRKYKIYANKEGYDSVENEFNTSIWSSKTNVLLKELILPREEVNIKLKPLKPFALYFDNDYPNPGSFDTLTDLTFSKTLAAYKSRKDEFKKGFTEGLTGDEKFIQEQQIEEFFEKELDINYKEFLKFSESLFQRLEFGRSITISVNAYASPIASERYNLLLTKRRISSILNFYRIYKDNQMRKYVDSGKLKIELIPYGESRAPKGISDNPRDRKNSVFSLAASKERKVEIVDLTSIKNKKTPTENLE